MKKKKSVMLTNTYIERFNNEAVFIEQIGGIVEFLKSTFSKEREIDIESEIRYPRESNVLIGRIVILHTDIPKRCLLIELRNDTKVSSWSYSGVDRFKSASAIFRSRFLEEGFDQEENISLEKILKDPLKSIRSIMTPKKKLVA